MSDADARLSILDKVMITALFALLAALLGAVGSFVWLIVVLYG